MTLEEKANELILRFEEETNDLGAVDLDGEIIDIVDTFRDRIRELETDLENMTEEKDIQYDRAEKLQGEVDDLEADVSRLEERVSELEPETLDDDHLEAIKIARGMKLAYERLAMGNNFEIDNIIELTNKLIELYL